MRMLLVAVVLLGALRFPVPSAADGLSADDIFARAKTVWRERDDAPYVSFALRERYLWRKRVHDNWWQVAYRSTDRALALRRQIVADDERARLAGTPITLHLKWHNGLARADSLETNAGADAFPILDPQIEPNASFGLVRHEQRVALVGPAPSPGVAAQATPQARASADAPPAGSTPLRVLATVEAAARDYRIDLDGTEALRGASAYHLRLTPLRDPSVYRLRDLWVDASTFATLQLAVAGLFDGEPYRSARWTISYVDVAGRPYIQEIRTGDELRFGADRFVSGLQFDFVQYALPPALPDVLFEHYL